VDDVHQYAALPFLRGLFGERVLGGIRLHVDAKRCLCATVPGYQAALSADSQRSLALQGGTFSAGQAQAFMAQAGAQDALQLRRWDDLAKTAGATTPPLQHFLQRAQRCALA
jgi:predicted HD phosphohydrolase